ncbi:MAG: hypothetical protein IKG79_08335 [Neisseriaceae bacterium]|nr:hypothetical protein [Neisseriaceae bacterium]
MKNKLLLPIVATLILTACATDDTPSPKTDTVMTPQAWYQCGNQRVAFAYENNSKKTATLTMSQIQNGNVTADTITLTKVEKQANETFANNARQVQWVNKGAAAEMTYPVNGVVQFVACQKK